MGQFLLVGLKKKVIKKFDSLETIAKTKEIIIPLVGRDNQERYNEEMLYLEGQNKDGNATVLYIWKTQPNRWQQN